MFGWLQKKEEVLDFLFEFEYSIIQMSSIIE